MQQTEVKVKLNSQPFMQYDGPFVHMAGLLPSGGRTSNFRFNFDIFFVCSLAVSNEGWVGSPNMP